MIYLCRHGQTAFNRERRIQGHMESDLTALGEQQAAAMADLLHDLTARDPPAPWRIVASPLRRTRATAAIIAARFGQPVEIDGRLIEVCCGEWEGRLFDDLRQEHTDAFADREWFFRAPGGETYEDVMGRVGGWLADQAEEPGRRLIVVSHGVAGRLLRGAYTGLPRAEVIDQDVPQDAIFRLSLGQIDRLECEPAEGEA